MRRPAFDVMEDLGLVTRLRDLATHVRRLVLVDNIGRPVASMPTRRSQDRELQIPRADLTAVLVAAARTGTESRFDDSILELEGDDRGVDVTFHRAAPQRFDLVVGADVSLLGEGSSSAIVGAATLATALQRSPQNLPAALARYEAIHRPVTARGQRAAPFASHLLVPASATGITLR